MSINNIFTLIFASCSLIFINSAFALDLGNEDDYKKTLIDFAGIAGTWYLNQRCNLLDEEKAKEFEWYVGKINIVLGKYADIAVLRRIQIQAQEASNREDVSDCGADATSLVNQGFDLSKRISYELTNEEYAPGKSLEATLTEKYRVAFVTYLLEQKCSHLPEEVRSDVMTSFIKIRDKLIKEKGQAFIDGIEKTLNRDSLFKKTNACSQTSHLYVNAGLSAIRELKDDLL